MKKIIIILAMLVITVSYIKAQDTIVGWTFPTGTSTDVHPDLGITLNDSMTIITNGGASAINWGKFGVTTYAAQATGWDSGANVKCWQVEINTTGYQDLKLNSLQESGGSYPGPRDFKAQYEIGTSGTWTDIPGTTVMTANNWTSAVISNVAIPTTCNNQASVSFRWIMTNDTSSTPPALVVSTGNSKIDNIIITGTSISSIINEILPETFSLYPNPAKESITVNCAMNTLYEIISVDGELVKKGIVNKQEIDVSGLSKGVYLFKIINNENGILVKKLLIQ
jgi:hypothetical protein